MFATVLHPGTLGVTDILLVTLYLLLPLATPAPLQRHLPALQTTVIIQWSKTSVNYISGG